MRNSNVALVIVVVLLLLSHTHTHTRQGEDTACVQMGGLCLAGIPTHTHTHIYVLPEELINLHNCSFMSFVVEEEIGFVVHCFSREVGAIDTVNAATAATSLSFTPSLRSFLPSPK